MKIHLLGWLGVFLLGSCPFYAASDITQLWETKKPSQKTIKSLWEKSRATSTKNVARKRSSTLSRIQNSRTTLEQTQKEQEDKNQQLEQIARSIHRVELENIAISKVLDRLEAEQKESESVYQEAKASIDQYGEQIDKLDQEIVRRNEEFIRLLADQFSLIAALQTIGQSTIDSIIQEEIYSVYKKRNNLRLARLKKEIDRSKQEKAKLLARQSRIKKSIQALSDKRELYQKKQKEKTELLAQLAEKEKAYRAQIKEIMQQQDLLRQTLAKLNILHKEEIAKARKAEEERRAELERKTAELKRLRQKQDQEIKAAKAAGKTVHYSTPKIQEPTAADHVKRYGSSYQNGNIQAYRGSRTISPLTHARVVKKFGTYMDPIYKIKIFNDNVVLEADKPGAKVRNVLNGKVVFIGQSSMLGKVVIVEHAHKLHTIYAALDRISPMLKNGNRVKKGTIIGRVKRKLIFQATQNSKYINPLRLIRL